MKRRVSIGEQDFDIVESFTIEQELYLAGLIRRGRLDRLPLRPAETVDRVVEVLLDAIERSRVGRQLLSVLLVPAGETWTMEEAAKTAAYLKEWIGTVDDDAADLLAVAVYQALVDRGVLLASVDAARGEEQTP